MQLRYTAKKNKVDMKTFKTILVIVILSSITSFSQSIAEYDTKEAAYAKLATLYPKPEDFIFKNSEGWKVVPLSSAKIIAVNDGEDIMEAQKIIDGEINTSWASKSYIKKPNVVIDLGSSQKINRILFYNRQTMNRGSVGGNNALRTVEISYAQEVNSKYVTLGKYELIGPKAVCVKIKGAGQICTFIDNSEPNIIEIPSFDARYLKLDFIEAFWEKEIPEDWKDSFALTELLLFNK